VLPNPDTRRRKTCSVPSMPGSNCTSRSLWTPPHHVRGGRGGPNENEPLVSCGLSSPQPRNPHLIRLCPVADNDTILTDPAARSRVGRAALDRKRYSRRCRWSLVQPVLPFDGWGTFPRESDTHC
jgi:hypothetical protein